MHLYELEMDVKKKVTKNKKKIKNTKKECNILGEVHGPAGRYAKKIGTGPNRWGSKLYRYMWCWFKGSMKQDNRVVYEPSCLGPKHEAKREGGEIRKLNSHISFKSRLMPYILHFTENQNLVAPEVTYDGEGGPNTFKLIPTFSPSLPIS